jgi:hypothetical protein
VELCHNVGSTSIFVRLELVQGFAFKSGSPNQMESKASNFDYTISPIKNEIEK